MKVGSWELTAHEDTELSWLVLTGPGGQACAFSAERGSVRAQILQDFMIDELGVAPAAPLVATPEGDSGPSKRRASNHVGE